MVYYDCMLVLDLSLTFCKTWGWQNCQYLAGVVVHLAIFWMVLCLALLKEILFGLFKCHFI